MAEIELTEAQQTMMRGDTFSPIVHVFGKLVDGGSGNMEVLAKSQPIKRFETVKDVEVKGKAGTKTIQPWRLVVCLQKARFWEGEFTMAEDGTSPATEIPYDHVPDWVWEELADMSDEGWHIYLGCEKMSREALIAKGPPPIVDPDEDVVNYDKIKTALMQLDHSNADHWTRDGKPNINTLRKMTRLEITKADLSVFGEELTSRKVVRVKLPGAAKR